MNSSLHRCNAFRSLVGSALFAAFALTLGTTLAVAQQGQAVPKTTAPKAAPAPAAAPLARAPAPGADAPEAPVWVKVCKKNEQTGNKQFCRVQYEGIDSNTGTVLVTATVSSVAGKDEQTLLVGITTANSLLIPAGARMKIDDSEPISLRYDVCNPTNCEAHLELTKEIFDQMRKGKQTIVAAMDMQEKSMVFLVPLTGFGKAFDGPPIDNAKYEEARRQMMEKRLELANRVAEQKKTQGVQLPQAGVPPQAGAQVPAPRPIPAQTKKPATPATP